MIALDTNILIYAMQDDPRSPTARSTIARAALIDCIVPAQVLAEFANVCRRKSIVDAAEVGLRLGELIDVFTIVETSASHVVAATLLAERYQLAYFDALICRIAIDSGATTLLSQDLQDGMNLDGLTILDPFNPANADRLAAILD